MELGLALLIIVIVIGVVLYNRLVRSRNFVKDAWAGIQVQLTKRHELIPLLITTVKAYTSHESGLHEKIVALRQPGKSDQLAETAKPESSFGEALAQIFALVEGYPELKADQNFRQLNQQLVLLENDIESARRYYNGSVRDHNIHVESFPSNMIARRFGFATAEFFELPLPSMSKAPQVAL